jgi:hypothetical protein
MRETLRRDYGRQVSRKKAARLMRENSLNAKGRKKFIPTTNSNHGLAICENILNREFQAGRGGGEMGVVVPPESHWLGLQYRYGDHPYDHSRLEMSFANWKAREGLIFHSDRGGAVLRESLSESTPGIVSVGSPEHEP